jgi:hypothetical protein
MPADEFNARSKENILEDFNLTHSPPLMIREMAIGRQ